MLRRHYSPVILSNNANPDNLHKEVNEGERKLCSIIQLARKRLKRK